MDVLGALGFDAGSMVALVGGRGKTRLAHALAAQAEERGWRTVLMGVDEDEGATAGALLPAAGGALVLAKSSSAGGRLLDATSPRAWRLPAQATVIVVVADLGVIGRRLTVETVADAGRAAALARQALGSAITAETVVRALEDAAHEAGLPLSAVLVCPPTAEHARLGSHIGARLVYGGYRTAVVTDGLFQQVHGRVR